MKVGIVGCGRIAPYHIPHVLDYSAVTGVALADTDRTSADSMARRFGIDRVFGSLKELLRAYGPHVVHVLTPPPSHAPLALQAMEQGCHVLVEKPMAMDAEEARSMVEKARSRDVALCVDHNFLQQPVVQRAIRRVENGAIGQVLHANARYAFDTGRIGASDDADPVQEWWEEVDLQAGLLFDSIPHPASLLLQFVGAPRHTSASFRSHGILPGGAPDELTVLVDGEERTGTLSVSLGTRPDCFTLDVFGSEGTLHVNCTNLTMVERNDRERLPKPLARAVDSLSVAAQTTSEVLSAAVGVALGRVAPPGDVGPVIRGFYASLEDGSPPPVPGEEAALTMDLAEAAWRAAGSAGGGRPAT